MMRPMRRSHHRAALTKAITAATARFQADLRRLARTVLQDELPRILATTGPMPTPTAAGRRAPRVEQVSGARSSAAARPPKPASAATARRTTAVTTDKPAAAARTSEPAAATRASKRATAAATSVEPAAARANRSTAAAVPVIAGTPEHPAAAIAEPVRELAAAVAQAELTPAGPRADLASVDESAPALRNPEPPWRERAGAGREERAQRRQERQDRARSRRAAAAAGVRVEPVVLARARAEPAAAVRAEPMTAALHEVVPATNGAQAVGRRTQRGTVKWFNAANGYGFLTADDGTDAFVHHSAISGEGFHTLSEGQPVSYEEVEGPKGLMAVNVVPTLLGTEARRG